MRTFLFALLFTVCLGTFVFLTELDLNLEVLPWFQQWAIHLGLSALAAGFLTGLIGAAISLMTSLDKD